VSLRDPAHQSPRTGFSGDPLAMATFAKGIPDAARDRRDDLRALPHLVRAMRRPHAPRCARSLRRPGAAVESPLVRRLIHLVS